MTMATIKEAAALTGVKARKIRDLCDQNKIPHHKGGRGAGNATLVDVDIVRQWTESPADVKQLLALADALPRIMAAEILKYWRELDRPDKRQLAKAFAAAWQICAVAVIEGLQEQNPDIPCMDTFPDAIRYLEKIADSRDLNRVR